MVNNEEANKRELENIRYNLKDLNEYLNDPALTNIFCSCEGKISIKKFGKPITDTPTILSISTRFLILNQIAKYMEININFNEYPVLEATIPVPEWKNSRITGIYPPWTEGPEFTIRKPPAKIYTLENYKENKQLTQERYDIIVDYVKNKKNIIVAGSTDSGKTTLINALIKKKEEYFPDDRYYIVQDVSELQCKAKYPTMIILRTEQALRGVALSLRYTPNIIIFGEVRKGNVMAELLDAWNTGHPGGFTSIHANSAALTLVRIKKLLLDHYKSEQALPDINEYVDLIIYIQKDNETGIVINDVMEMKKYEISQSEEELMANFKMDFNEDSLSS
jgi:type IV secretion system protein VirB11